MESKELSKKIQDLISQNDKDYKEIKDRWAFLYKKRDELKELEAIEWLSKRKDGGQFLRAYLTYKSISRANFQMELLKHANFEEGEGGQEKLLNAIRADVEAFEKRNKVKQKLPTEKLSNELLLKMLGERIAAEEIKSDCERTEDGGAWHLWIGEGKNGEYPTPHDWADETKWILKLSLGDGKIETRIKQEKEIVENNELNKEIQE